MSIKAHRALWSAVRHAVDVPILVSHAVPDGPWAAWIADELRAAGYTVDIHIARSDFAHRILTALAGSDPVLALHSAEHPGTVADWKRIAKAGGTMITLCVDAAAPPPALRCRTLHDLTEEDVRELVLTVVTTSSLDQVKPPPGGFKPHQRR